MAASLKQDYTKILKAGADLVMISPDSLEQHRQYALKLFGEELPYLYVRTAISTSRSATACSARKNITTAVFIIAHSGY